MPTHFAQKLFERPCRYKRSDDVEQILALSIFEKRENIRMVKLTNLFRLSHKIVAKGRTLSKPRTKDLHCHIIIALITNSTLTSTIYICNSPFSHALQQEVVTQYHTF